MAKVFGVIKIIVRAAPIGAFGAMAFTVGAFGVFRCGTDQLV
jgi:Na+/H+-dicarboxylate symporter